MAARSAESRWPKKSDGTTNISLDDIGYASGDPNTYTLVSYLPKRLFVGIENNYVVFVCNGQDITHYNWRIREFDFISGLFLGNDLGTDRVTVVQEANQRAAAARQRADAPGVTAVARATALAEAEQARTEATRWNTPDRLFIPNGTSILSWTPGPEDVNKRFEISVELKINNTTITTLILIQNVFARLTDSEALDEVEAFAITTQRDIALTEDQRRTRARALRSTASVLGDNEKTFKILYSYWEYIVEESYNDSENGRANFAINPMLIAAIILRSCATSSKVYEALEEKAVDSVIKFNARYRHKDQHITLSIAAMVLNRIGWQDKVDPDRTSTSESSWRNAALNMKTAFDNLSKEVQIEVYNYLRFPKLYVKIIYTLFRKVRDDYFIAHSASVPTLEDLILKQFIKYSHLDIKDLNFIADSINRQKNIFIKSVFNIPNFQANNNLSVIPSTATGLQSLDNDLRSIGFTDITVEREWAIREFQIYSKMKFIAKEKENSPSATPIHQKQRRAINLFPYTGPVSGIANPDTLRTIQFWKAMNWRCPVVVSAFDGAGFNNLFLGGGNLWGHLSLQTQVPRFFVQDYSNYWNIPRARKENNTIFEEGRIVLGTYYPTGPSNYYEPPNPPVAGWVNPAVWDPVTEITNVLNGIAGADNDTRRIIRAVISVEAGTYLEIFNAWDAAHFSMGFFHWTIGRQVFENPPPNPRLIERGELQAVLSLLKLNYPSTFLKTLIYWGINVHEDWRRPISGNSPLWLSSQRKYAGYFTYQNEDFTWLNGEHNNAYISNGQRSNNRNYHRTWHSCYRWVMLMRIYLPNLSQVFWDMARIRLIDILNGPWPDHGIGAIRDNTGNPIGGLTFSYIFRSTRSIALILRWHANSPDTFYNGHVNIYQVVNDAMGGGNWGFPDTWPQNADREQSICNEIENSIRNTNILGTPQYIANPVHRNSYSSLRATIPIVNNNPTLNATRLPGNFVVDNANLPISIHS